MFLFGGCGGGGGGGAGGGAGALTNLTKRRYKML
jgi:hypothetical protein